jgi:hypothetical protein
MYGGFIVVLIVVLSSINLYLLNKMMNAPNEIVKYVDKPVIRYVPKEIVKYVPKEVIKYVNKMENPKQRPRHVNRRLVQPQQRTHPPKKSPINNFDYSYFAKNASSLNYAPSKKTYHEHEQYNSNKNHQHEHKQYNSNENHDHRNKPYYNQIEQFNSNENYTPSTKIYNDPIEQFNPNKIISQYANHGF